MCARGLLLAVALAGCGPGKKAANEPIPPPPRYQSGPALGPEPALGASAEHREWLESVHGRLHDRWLGFTGAARTMEPPSHALNRADLEATVALTLGLDGKVLASNLSRASGVESFDAVVMEIISEISPLPPPPASAVSDDGRVYLTWTFARDARQDAAVGAKVERREFDVLRAARVFLAEGRLADAVLRLVKAIDARTIESPETLEASRLIAAFVLELRAREGELFERMLAIRALGEGFATSAIPTLEKLLADPERDVRAFAAEALGALGHLPAKPALIKLAKVMDGTISVAAAAALARLGVAETAFPEVAGELAAAKSTPAVIRTVSALRDRRATPWLTGLVRATSGDTRLAAIAALTLAPLDEDAAKALVAAAGKKSTPDARIAALTTFSAHGASAPMAKSIAFLASELIKDPAPRIRAAAARALLTIGGAAQVASVTRKLAKEKSSEVLRAAAEGLGTLGTAMGDTGIKTLRTFLLSTDADLRAAAVTSLVAAGQLDVLPTSDSSPAVRILILRTQPALAEQAMSDEDPIIRAETLAIVAAKGDRTRAARAFLEGHLLSPISAAWLRGTGVTLPGPNPTTTR